MPRRVCLTVVLALMAVILAAAAKPFLFSRADKLPHGLHYGNWNLSGYDWTRFEREFDRKVRKWKHIRLTLHVPPPFDKKTEVTFEELGLYMDSDMFLEELKKWRSGSRWNRLWQGWKLRNQTYSPVIKLQGNVLRQTVSANWPQIERTVPVDARRNITEDDRVEYTREKPAYRVDWSRLETVLLRQARERMWPPDQPAVSPSRLPPEDEWLLPGTSVTVPLKTVMPETTVEQLKAQKIERKIAEFTTYFRSSSEGRVHNIRSAAKIIHDRLMAPGEVFDYSEVVKLTEQKYGFKPAPVILNGRLVPGIGGGICQVSSTLYNAVLLAGLEIVEREHHSLPVRYVPLGQDATFASGHINFRFRNHEKSHLLIRTESSPAHLTVKLFGALPAGTRYRVESKVVKTIPPPVKYVQNRSLAPGRQKVIRQGKNGYIVETERIRIKDGKEVERQLISRDHYRPQSTLIATWGTYSPEPKSESRPPVLEDGVNGPVFSKRGE